MTVDPDGLLTAAEAAAIFRVHPYTVGRWVKAGKLDAVRTPGGRIRVRSAHVEELLRGESQAAAERAAAERRERGPWFAARYDGTCSGCDIEITAGDDIRSDGDGGWLCGGCGDEP